MPQSNTRARIVVRLKFAFILGKPSYFTLTATAAISAFLLSQPALGGVIPIVEREPSFHILAVGVDEYENPELNLRYATSDARKLASTFQQSPLAESVQLLTDAYATRANIIASLRKLRESGNSGSSLIIYWAANSHYDPVADDLLLYGSDGNPYDKETSISLLNDIVPLSSEDHPIIFIGDGCNIGGGLVGKVANEYPHVSVISASKLDEYAIEATELSGSPFAYFLVEGLHQAPDLDDDGFISVEELHHYVYPRVVDWSRKVYNIQHPSVAGRYIHRHILAYATESTTQFHYRELPEDFVDGNGATINGRFVKSFRMDPTSSQIFLSETDSGMIQKGVNVIETTKRRFLVWREGNRLEPFSSPYRTSRAIIVAIDDYDRKLDPEKRGATGFNSLDSMVNRAKDLVDVLVDLGFDEDNIFPLYNHAATSSAIEGLLEEFWQGGRYEDTDRLFIYFGAHGYVHEEQGLIVTYDFDPIRPTATSVHMADIRGRFSRNIVAHHALFAIDVCYAGLALKDTLNRFDASEISGEEFEKLANIRADVEAKARNVLLAGTGSERAVYDNGGIFTQALTAGLSGKADFNRDGLIQWHEINGYVRNKVSARASETGVRQNPDDEILDLYGEGRVVFLLDNNAANPVAR